MKTALICALLMMTKVAPVQAVIISETGICPGQTTVTLYTTKLVDGKHVLTSEAPEIFCSSWFSSDRITIYDMGEAVDFHLNPEDTTNNKTTLLPE